MHEPIPDPQELLLTLFQIWKIEANGEERKVTYLSTLKKHTQAVNVVRWCPRGMLIPPSSTYVF
jgi:hypothetical protein